MKIQTVVTTLALLGTALPALALQYPDPVRPLAKGEPGHELQQTQMAKNTPADTEAMDCSTMPCCKHMKMTGKAKEDCMKMSKDVCLKMLKPQS